MKALLIGSTLLEELGIEEYKKIAEESLRILGYEVFYPDLEAERKALILHSIGARILGSQSLKPIKYQAIENDLVVYLTPCSLEAFREMKFSTPVEEKTIYELILPRVKLELKGKALLACKRHRVRPGIKEILSSYGLELEEDCIYPHMKIYDYNEYSRTRSKLVEAYRDYILTCPYQAALFKDEGVEYKEILALAYHLLKSDGSD